MRRLKFTYSTLASPAAMQLQRLQRYPTWVRVRVPEHGKCPNTLYDAHIMPKDLLTITVNTSDPDAAIPFNLTVATPSRQTAKPYQPTIPATVSGRQYLEH